MSDVSQHDRPPAVTSAADAVRRLFGRGSVYTLVLAIQMSTALLAVPIVTRLLTPVAYGQVAAGIVVYTVLSIIGAAGLPDAAARTFFDGATGPRRAKQLVLAATLLALLMSTVFDLTGGVWAPLFGLRYGGVLRCAVWAGGAGAILLATQSVLRVSERVWAFLAVAAIASVGGQTIGVTLTAALHTGTAYMAGIAAGAGLAAVTALVLGGHTRAGVAGRRDVLAGLSLGLPIVPHSLAVSMLASADRILIAGILGLAAAGRYQVAYAVGGIGVALVTAVGQAWLPLVLGAPERVRWEVLRATSAIVHVLAAMVAAGLALLAPLALLLAAPPSYGRHSLVPVAALVAFSALPYATCGTYFQVVFVTGRTRIMALAAPVAAAVNIVLNLVLLRSTGLLGAALATVAAYAVLPCVVAARAARMVPLHGVAREAARSWLLAAPFVAAGALLPSDALGVAARVVLAIAVGATGYALVRSTMRRLPRPAGEPEPAFPRREGDGSQALDDGTRLAATMQVSG